MPTTTATTILRGGEFLIQASEGDAVFTPEQLTEVHIKTAIPHKASAPVAKS